MWQILTNMKPYHQFADVLFRSAADSQSPLNPLSIESEAVRKESIEWFAEPKQVRTWRLMEQTVEIITRLISIASLPLMRPLRKSMLKLLADLRADAS